MGIENVYDITLIPSFAELYVVVATWIPPLRELSSNHFEPTEKKRKQDENI